VQLERHAPVAVARELVLDVVDQSTSRSSDRLGFVAVER